MTKEKLLTVRLNNLLSLALGIPTLAYVVVVLSTSILSDGAAFFTFTAIGVLYWVVVEQHAAMRFAWLRENSPDHASLKESPASRLVFNVYNLVWWAPLVLSLIRIIDYRTGLIAFFVITVIRAAANLYRNNVLSLEQAEVFPLRAP